MRNCTTPPVVAAAAAALFALASPSVAQQECREDVEFALDALEERCGHFFDLKGIAWKKVRRNLGKAAKKAESEQEHFEVLVRLVAALRDGHARVLVRGERKVQWPGPTDTTGPGMFWCRIGKRIFVKNSWAGAAELGVVPGAEVTKVDGVSVSQWLRDRVESLREFQSFSTDHQADFYACHWGLAQPAGTRMKLELKMPGGKKSTRTITYTKANPTPNGPAFLPEGMTFGRDVHHARLESGHGYVHVRRCKGDLPQQVDEALAALEGVEGLILDFRGNSGGSFDHDALMGRFVPPGKTLSFGKTYGSAGPAQFTGPVVVIVDATVRSAGETASGMFKEDGRAYMIGESPTAGMSASKETLELPSEKFALYFAVHSNKKRFQGGRGIEGIGIEPHEIVSFDADDLAAEKDTLILRADALLEKFPASKVPYRAP